MDYGLSPAQKAAATRKENRANGVTAGKPAASERAAGLECELRIVPEDSASEPALRLEFGFIANGGPAPLGLLSDADRALMRVQVFAFYQPTEGEPILSGYLRSRADLPCADVATLEVILPLMRRLDTFIGRAIEESDDDSFAQVVSALAAHFRVSRVRYPSGDETREAKRGAAYITAHRIAESFLARHASDSES